MSKEKKSKKTIIVLIVAVAVIMGVTLRILSLNREFLYAGTIEATKVDIPARVSSVIAEFSVAEGDRVEAGQSVVTLACEDVKLAADVAVKDFTRAEKLLSSGSMPREAYDHLKSKRDESVLKLGWCGVKSPVKGTVLTTYREPGEWVSPGMKLLTVADLGEVWAIVYVPSTLLHKLSPGMSVVGILPEAQAGEREFKGKITRISDEAEFTPKNVQTREERTRLVYGVKVTFENAKGVLKAGMPIEVRLE
jgi:HlyD family secretion protein